MNSSESNSKLPTWLFVVSDLALIAVAALIAYFGRPLSTTHIFMIVGCVGLGAIVGLVPLVLRYEQQKNEALDDRQRALEALARTVASSAEQISIAANGLHEIADLAQKNLRHAEQLPHKLQEKMAEFQAQLAAAEDEEKEELERELLSLRTTESERLESVSQRIAKSSAEWAKLEAATQQHLAAATEALSKISLGTAAAIGKAQVAAEQALGQARIEAARHVGEAGGQATRAIETAKTAALADFEGKVITAIDRAARALETGIARLENTAPAVAGSGSPATPSPTVAPAPGTEENSSVHQPSEEPVAAAKRPRKPRREEPEAPPAAEKIAATPAAPAVSHEPTPVPADKIPEIAPVAPHTAEPFPGTSTNGAGASPAPVTAAPVVAEPPKSRKRSAAKKPEAEPASAGLALEIEDAPATAGSASERVLSSDGATRLLVTAYIGIGNRLFIRGEGAGLTWEKGVPLQFVSIGKWRWETNEASAPLRFKLYKNDDLECSALGAQTLDPGYQQELTAAF